MSRKRQTKEKKAGDIHPFYLNDNNVVNEFINKQTNANEGLRVAIELFVSQFGNIDVSKFVPNRRDPETLENILPILEMASKIEGNTPSSAGVYIERNKDAGETESAPSQSSINDEPPDNKNDGKDMDNEVNQRDNVNFVASNNKNEGRNQENLLKDEDKTESKNSHSDLRKDSESINVDEHKVPQRENERKEKDGNDLNHEEESPADNDDMPSWMTE
ncbi:hypothetical protein [Halobacillus litoralis]|uniref:Uncharacterized protein n=1 Tax=Halobacillus litoralis TaxID=45668 RepID=A0A410MJ95_9BACI|nr:hypothetical protein [Halobacillus litoralis]QAS54802.1 hypothetical protein HLI_21340 [Halobacillus litoralis]